MPPLEVPRGIFTTVIPGTGQHDAAGSVPMRAHPGDTDMTDLSPVTKTTQTRRRTTAPGMVSGATQ